MTSSMFGKLSRCHFLPQAPTTLGEFSYETCAYNLDFLSAFAAAEPKRISVLISPNTPKHSEPTKNLSRQIPKGTHFGFSSNYLRSKSPLELGLPNAVRMASTLVASAIALWASVSGLATKSPFSRAYS